jgi:hypothetical protein
MNPMKVKWTKIKDAEPMGDYKATPIDQAKKEADIRLINVSPKIIDCKVALKGRGIKQVENVAGRYQVSDKAWSVLTEQYTWITDF